MTGSVTGDGSCGKCGATFLRLDRLILARTGGRLIRISCALCGWDWYLNR